MKMTRSCRAELPVDVWDALAARARADGMTLGSYARAVLTEHVKAEVLAASTSEPAPVLMNVDLWHEVVAWFNRNPNLHRAYTGDRKDPVECIKYARQHGFTG